MSNMNRKNGNAFEWVMANYLKAQGFWVHLLRQGMSGQPADLIVCKGIYHALIDCKVIDGSNSFRFSRIEPNQRTSMAVFQGKAEETGWFMLRWPDQEITMLSMRQVIRMEKEGYTRLSMDDRETYSLTLDDWLWREKLANRD